MDGTPTTNDATGASSAHSGGTRRRRSLALAAAFVVPCLAAMALIRVAAPPNPDYAFHPTLTAKLDHLAETDEHYELVFVGDSRVFRAFDPMLIEDELTRLGCPARTYNMGAVAMTKLEFDHVMDVLGRAPGGTPEVIVSVDALTLLVGLLKDFSVRHRVHMDARDMRRYLEYKANLPAEDFGTDRLELADTAAGFAFNQIPVGAIHQQLFEQQPTQDDTTLAAELRGYIPWRDFYAEAGDEGLANLYATLAPELENGGWDRRWTTETPSSERLDAWVRTIAAHVDAVPTEATAVHLFVPSFFDAGTTAAVTAAWEESGRTEPVVNLVDESLVGDFTDPAFFIDYWHLSEAGSDAVSRAAAQQLCPIVRSATETS